LETTNPVLLAACGFVPASLIAITAFEAFGSVGASLVALWYAAIGVGKWHFPKQIGMMEVWSEMFENADLQIGMEDLKIRQRGLDEAMGAEKLEKMSQETVLSFNHHGLSIIPDCQHIQD
jgi:hypothetical protein